MIILIFKDEGKRKCFNSKIGAIDFVANKFFVSSLKEFEIKKSIIIIINTDKIKEESKGLIFFLCFNKAEINISMAEDKSDKRKAKIKISMLKNKLLVLIESNNEAIKPPK